MPDVFLRLSKEERHQVLSVAATKSGRPIHLLEKDVWVVWTLNVLFTASFADKLTFKGGTSLSKAYETIRRFSEDIDITYDIRSIAHDLTGDAAEPLPRSRSQEKKWTSEIRERLPVWISKNVLSLIEEAIAKEALPARARAEREKIIIEYDPLATGTGYVAPTIIIEFGARSTGEPCEVRPVTCDAARFLPDVVFPTAKPRVMLPERTFWEKATAIHVYCARGEFRGSNRFSRHWYDVVKLDEAGFADKAIANREIANAVATHKSIFFSEDDITGKEIDYAAAVNGKLHLVPTGDALTALADDYKRMVDDGLLLDKPVSFDALLMHCKKIQSKANAQLQPSGQPR